MRSVCAAALTAATALAAPVPSAPAAAAPAPVPAPAPAEQSVAELLTQLKTLYRKAEEASEAYNATEEKLRKQRAKTRALTAALVRTRAHLAISRDEAGQLAREQYQGRTQLSSYHLLMALLSPSPDQVTEQTRELGRAADRQAILVERLTRGEAHAEDLAKRGRAALKKQLSLTTKRKKQRDRVEKRLTTIERTLASLTLRQLRELAEREYEETERAQRELLASGALDPPVDYATSDPWDIDTGSRVNRGKAPDPKAEDAPPDAPPDTPSDAPSDTPPDAAADPEDTGTAPEPKPEQEPEPEPEPKPEPKPKPEESEEPPPQGKEPPRRTTPGHRRTPRRPSAAVAAGHRALKYALNQIGKPYVWGAEGPGSFDCSGLTYQAWAHAGRPIPRTSQQQWRRLPRVKLNELRPGDLVVYFKGASHVAIYAGNGMVVQAPRPGGRVKLSPLASNPLRGAVRPTARGKTKG
ncbi:NLP/P60 family secreted protein [Streptomyces bingchenggensis BCW-1]|uniref:NLP/P60 family secreted protein n=2 Tax=Streptomyces TaxID=1883 RepID=D7CHC8_STRBB|nr:MULTISPECIES: C40 family peptidase [Streptomyces]ADI06985.1 NLP/P60 family secreted protein [Streptomyces bingchenggensis BCW-1]